MDFEKKCNTGYYVCGLPYGYPKSAERQAYRDKETELHLEFNADLRTYLCSLGVPEKHADKVADIAYDQGHSGGYSEILSQAQILAGIFQP